MLRWGKGRKPSENIPGCEGGILTCVKGVGIKKQSIEKSDEVKRESCLLSDFGNLFLVCQEVHIKEGTKTHCLVCAAS